MDPRFLASHAAAGIRLPMVSPSVTNVSRATPRAAASGVEDLVLTTVHQPSMPGGCVNLGRHD